jgi:hypothetical protein
MHGTIRQHNECSAENTEADSIDDLVVVVEAKRAQNRCSRHFNVKAIFVINEAEWRHFVDYEAFEAVVENRELLINTMSAK